MSDTDHDPLPDPDQLARLRAHFLDTGYTVEGVSGLLGEVAHAALSRGEPVPAIRATRGGSPLEVYVRMFLLGLPVPAERAAALPAGWVQRDGGQVRAALDVRPYATAGPAGTAESEWYVVSDLGTDARPGPLRPDHVLGVGGASTTLAGATVRGPVATALDLGTGCGVQALHLSRHAGRVTATDSNPRALRMAAASAGLSGLPVPELLAGDLWEPVGGRRFDLVVSNPPFVVGPGRRYEYRDSGLPGDELLRRLLAGMAGRLTGGGVAQLLGNWLHVAGQDWRERLAPWLAATGCDAWVVQREVADPAEYVAMWLRDSGDEEDRDLADAWLDALEAAGVEGVGFGLVSLRASGADRPVVRMEELLRPVVRPVGEAVAGWFDRAGWLRETDDATLLTVAPRRAPDLTLETVAAAGPDGWEPARRTLVAAAGWERRGAVDEAGAALVAGCDGGTPLGALLMVLEAVYGVQRPDALVAVRDLIETGFLLP